jgi:hypothetical protein
MRPRIAFPGTGETPIPRDRPVFWLPDHPPAEPSQSLRGIGRQSRPARSGTRLHACLGRWLATLAYPLIDQWSISAIVPGYSDGLAPDSHRLPDTCHENVQLFF